MMGFAALYPSYGSVLASRCFHTYRQGNIRIAKGETP
jgi:hypothetical protein